MDIFHQVDMVIWVIKEGWVHFWTRESNCCLSRTCVFVCIFVLLKFFGRDIFLWLFWKSCYLGAFSCIYNGPLKGKCSSAPLCFVNNYLTPLLLSPHPVQFFFSYGIDEVLDIWRNLVWYCLIVFVCWCWWLMFFCWYFCLVFLCWLCLLVFLWVCWFWFAPLWCWNLFPKFLLKMGSIIEWDGVMSMSDVYRISNISSILGWMLGIVLGFVSDVQTFYNIAQKWSRIFEDASILKVPLCIYLWGCWFVLLDITSNLVHFWL